MRFIPLLFLCTSCLGQGFLSFQVPDLSGLTSGTTGPKSVGGLEFYWNSSDLATQITVASWSDEIQGKLWTNSGATKPTTTTNSDWGVHFTRSAGQALFSTGVVWNATSTNGTLWMAISYDSIPASFQDLLSSSGGGATFGLRNTKVFYYFSGLINESSALTPTANKYIDLAMTKDSIAGQTVWYTNGVAAETNAVGVHFTDSWIELGNSANGATDGNLGELAFYTNIISQASITALHTYITNKLKFSP